MRKIILGVLALMLAVPSVALVHKVNTPRDQRGEAALPDYGGYLYFRVSGADEQLVCSGRCLLRALIMSTGPASSYLQVRNSSVTQANGQLVLGKYVRFSVAQSSPAGNPLPYPIVLDKGITVDLSSVSADEDVTVLYLDLDD